MLRSQGCPISVAAALWTVDPINLGGRAPMDTLSATKVRKPGCSRGTTIGVPSTSCWSVAHQYAPTVVPGQECHAARPMRFAFASNVFASAAMPTSSTGAAAPRLLHAARCMDKAGAIAVRKTTRPAHLEWASDIGNVAFGGPFVDADGMPKGSLLILQSPDANTADEANASVTERLAVDPYKTAGLFENVEVRRWVCGMRVGEELTDGSADGEKKLFCVWCVDGEGKRDLRKQTRPAHLEWWKSSGRRGLIGPFPAPDGDGAVGTLIVCEGDSLEEITTWAETDPYAKAELFEHVHVYPMKKTLDTLAI